MTDLSAVEVERIHRRRTGALIRAATRCGAIAAGANEHEAVTEYATNLGLLFQITDDLLDVTASAEDLGKTPGKDARSRKATYRLSTGLKRLMRNLKSFIAQPAMHLSASIGQHSFYVRSQISFGNAEASLIASPLLSLGGSHFLL